MASAVGVNVGGGRRQDGDEVRRLKVKMGYELAMFCGRWTARPELGLG